MSDLDKISQYLAGGNGCRGVLCDDCPLFDRDCGVCLRINRESADRIKAVIINAVMEDTKVQPLLNPRTIADSLSKTSSRNTPDYYRLDPEPVDVIRKWDLNFCLGNVVKYAVRAGRKPGESRDSDLHKAMHYLRLELEDERK